MSEWQLYVVGMRLSVDISRKWFWIGFYCWNSHFKFEFSLQNADYAFWIEYYNEQLPLIAGKIV